MPGLLFEVQRTRGDAVCPQSAPVSLLAREERRSQEVRTFGRGCLCLRLTPPTHSGGRSPNRPRYSENVSAAHIPAPDLGSGPRSSGPSFHAISREGVHSRNFAAPYRYVVMRLEETVAELAGASSTNQARLLDYGCALRPYERLFGPKVKYIGADLEGNSAADVWLRPDGSVPEPDRSFDMVLSTQVLEHVSDPASYLLECFRVLRPGGALVLTTHGLMYRHADPEDFWRWTRDGLVKQVAAAGFTVSDVQGVLGLASASLQLFQDATARHVPRRLRWLYIGLMQQLVAFADRRYSVETRALDALVLAIGAKRPDEETSPA